MTKNHDSEGTTGPNQMGKTGRESAQHKVFSGVFRSVVNAFKVLCRKAAHLVTTHLNVLYRRSVVRSVVQKLSTQQWCGRCHNTTTLLLSIININVHTHTYACVHRGSYRTGLEVWLPRSALSDARRTVPMLPSVVLSTLGGVS